MKSLFSSKVPLRAWDLSTDDEKYVNLGEAVFSGGTCFSTYQAALVSVLELLGTRKSPLPVIMPVTAPPDTMSAVLRGGAVPFLLDVDYKSLQMNPTQLQEALSSLPAAIVVLTCPGGQKLSESLLELVSDYPTIVDTRWTANPKKLETLGSFTVYDLTEICGNGAVVYHKFEKQQSDLRVVRNGILGQDARITWTQGREIKARGPLVEKREAEQKNTYDSYTKVLLSKGLGGMIIFREAVSFPHYLVRVSNPARVSAHLSSYGIESALGVYPLHLVPELASRWKETPSYEGAELLSKEVLALPTLPRTDTEFVIEKILEVTE